MERWCHTLAAGWKPSEAGRAIPVDPLRQYPSLPSSLLHLRHHLPRLSLFDIAIQAILGGLGIQPW